MNGLVVVGICPSMQWLRWYLEVCVKMGECATLPGMSSRERVSLKDAVRDEWVAMRKKAQNFGLSKGVKRENCVRWPLYVEQNHQQTLFHCYRTLDRSITLPSTFPPSLPRDTDTYTTTIKICFLVLDIHM